MYLQSGNALRGSHHKFLLAHLSKQMGAACLKTEEICKTYCSTGLNKLCVIQIKEGRNNRVNLYTTIILQNAESDSSGNHFQKT